MPTRRSILSSAIALALTVFSVPTNSSAAEQVPVVATFSILGDMVARIGGEHIALTTLVGPQGDAHVYQPTPQAARAVAEADVLFVNGLEFEGWLERLVEAASFNGTMVTATTGIDPIAYENHDDHEDEHAEGEGHDDHNEHAEGEDHDDHDDHAAHDHGTHDPHTWLSPKLAITYADNITAALAIADPEHATEYYQKRAAFVDELKALDEEISAMMATLPKERRTVVTSHDAFQYFARDYGLTFKAPQGLSTNSEASAKDVAAMIQQIRQEGISAVFIENIADSRLLEQIANETGATVGGTLYPGALSQIDGPAATYLDLMRHNAKTISLALGS